MGRLRVYLSGPLTNGGRASPQQVKANLRQAIRVGRELVKRGYAVFIPHLTYYLDPKNELGSETWYEVDTAWLTLSHAVYRLPGESTGADREVAEAQRLGIPVVHTLEELSALSPKSASSLRGHLEALERLHNRKRADYGTPADPFANIRASEEWGIPAWVGALVRQSDKLRRLMAFYKKGRLFNEGVQDSLMDNALYAIIAWVLWEEANGGQGASTTPGG